ncbi:hypothetical protein WOLCODRAFT_161119 [Wolfiporia cocos MD-104 SS10]|uniref:Uncharacterized protein n=1 Tax=Wolfiporia cocos (strain MD-104) TaxID=742152 RepID=A0A2H3J6N4_WOLCO|nr:hypothetical protein WOLCODRAFT_161119 [Wolfiporia cocos MD-104 SS10]
MTSITWSDLPIELWLHIFRLSTTSPETQKLHATTYRPFDTVIVGLKDVQASRTKAALVRVCRRWREWAERLLYEDLSISSPKEVPPVLLSNACGTARESDGGLYSSRSSHCGQWVRRIVLPYSFSIPTISCTVSTHDILQQCQSLEVLVCIEPCPHSGLPVPCPPLPSLKRFDGLHIHTPWPTEGVNMLGDMLLAAPNLQYLSIGESVVKLKNGSVLKDGPAFPRPANPSVLRPVSLRPVGLPMLTTLRLLPVLNDFLMRQLGKWSLPALRHLVIDGLKDPYLLTDLWETFGAQIRIIELGSSLRYFIYDILNFVLCRFPKVKELNYYIFFTGIPKYYGTYDALVTVGLHCAQWDDLLMPESTETWEHLQGHFASLSGPIFLGLKRIVLYASS